MSLIRLFLSTAYTLTAAGEFALLREYMATVAKVLAANEVVIIPGTPADKPLSNK